MDEQFKQERGAYTTPKGYDIKKELGRVFFEGEAVGENRYDQMAMNAQVYGMKFGFRDLVVLGEQLADLILKIPYNHDKFYLVQAKAREIELKIAEYSEQSIEVFFTLDENGDTIREIFARNFFTNPEEKYGNYLQISNWSTHKEGICNLVKELVKTIGAEFEGDVANFLEKIASRASSADFWSRSQRHTHTINKTAKLFFESWWHTSGNVGYGFWFYFDSAELMNTIKNKIVSTFSLQNAKLARQ